jgi:cardiolipin synthase
MTTEVFTLANQLTLVRLLLIPVFVILTLYGEFGWSLAVFAFAGLTDLLDGLAARLAGQKSELGAWLDPAADKLLLVTTFIVLTLPNIGLVNRIPLRLTILIISRDVGIVLTVAIVNLAVGPRTF